MITSAQRMFGFLFLFMFPLLEGTSQTALTQLGHKDYSSSLNDIWGHVDTAGNEYALVGLQSGGISVVDVSTPSNPQEVFFQSGPTTTWRDIKVWNEHAYITSETGSNYALMIVDLSPLPDTNLTVDYYDPGSWHTAHNLAIDDSGRAYIFGADRSAAGVIMLDLTQDPKNPVEIDALNTKYVHDGMVRNDTMFLAHVNDGLFSMIDISDPFNHQLILEHGTPYSFTHNIWPSDNGDHVFTTDEVDGAPVTSFDVSTPGNVRQLDKIRSEHSSNVPPHNTFYKDGLLYSSYYKDGVLVFDASQPDNLIEIGHFDTSPLSSGGFEGCWGVYPWLPSENLLVSDMQEGLFILGDSTQKAAYLKGMVTNAQGIGISNVSVSFVSGGKTDQTNLFGNYSTGQPSAGNYSVIFEHPRYFPDTINGMVLQNDSTTNLDVSLSPRGEIHFTGQVTTPSGDPIPFARVNVRNEDFNHMVATDLQGKFSIDPVYEGDYEIRAGKWGFVPSYDYQVKVDSANSYFSINLEFGYYDDMTLDLGWNVSGDAETGVWERTIPAGTYFQQEVYNAPYDVPDDNGQKAFVTGNDNTTLSKDEVSGGATHLISPAFDLSSYTAPHLSCHYWFATLGGPMEDRDTLFLRLLKNNQFIPLDTISFQGSPGDWKFKEFKINEHTSPQGNMQFVVSIHDRNGIYLEEAGLDLFRITEGPLSLSPKKKISDKDWMIHPNPYQDAFHLSPVNLPSGATYSWEIMDLTGKRLQQGKINTGNGATVLAPKLEAGAYFLILKGPGGRIFTKKIIHTQQ